MNPPGAPDIQQAIALFGTITAGVSLVLGLTLLFVGVRLIRAIYTMAFTFLGAGIGLVAGYMYWPQSVWLAGVAGAVVVGLVGFLLYRIWIMLTFGTVLATVGAASWYLAASQAGLTSLWTQGASIVRDYVHAAQATAEMQKKIIQQQRSIQSEEQSRNLQQAQRILGELVEKLPANPSQEDVARLLAEAAEKFKAAGLSDEADYARFASAAAAMRTIPRRQQAFVEDARRVLSDQALGASIAAAVGLMLGLIIAGASWRLAAVLLTAAVGLKWTMLSIYWLIALHRPEMFDRYPFFGLKGLLLPGGLLLMGLAVQGLLARSSARAAKAAAERKKAAAQPVPPADPPPAPQVIPLAESPVPPRKIEYAYAPPSPQTTPPSPSEPAPPAGEQPKE